MVSFDFIWALVSLAVLASALLLVDRLAVRWQRSETLDSDDRTALIWVRRILKALAVILVFGFAVGLWPFRWEYHSYQPVTGTVAEVSPRLTNDGAATTEAFAVRYAGHGAVYRCDDTRCALVKPGDKLVLRCKREYEWASTDGYGCRFVRHSPRPTTP